MGAVVSFTLDGLAMTAVTNAVGVASAPASPGTYVISVVIDGDASFNHASTSKDLVVS